MVIKYKKKTWVEKNVKIRFAFWPHEDSGTGEFFGLNLIIFMMMIGLGILQVAQRIIKVKKNFGTNVAERVDNYGFTWRL